VLTGASSQVNTGKFYKDFGMSSHNSMVIPHESVRILIGTGRNLHIVPPEAFTSVWWPHGPVRTQGSMDFVTYRVAETDRCIILSAKQLGRKGVDLGKLVKNFVDKNCGILDDYFNINVNKKFTLVLCPLSEVLDGSGGAYYYRGKSDVFYVDAAVYPNTDCYRSLALFISQAAEFYQSLQGSGWHPDGSNGEALSRVIAEVFYPYALDGFETVSSWLDSDRVNWIDVTNDTDSCDQSNGCGVLFIYWLNKVLGFSLSDICRDGGSTLGETYYKLTGKTTGYVDFMTAVEDRWPNDKPCNVFYDNPW
jgi:hypothetical protein